jgi:hypothetical protein
VCVCVCVYQAQWAVLLQGIRATHM